MYVYIVNIACFIIYYCLHWMVRVLWNGYITEILLRNSWVLMYTWQPEASQAGEVGAIFPITVNLPFLLVAWSTGHWSKPPRCMPRSQPQSSSQQGKYLLMVIFEVPLVIQDLVYSHKMPFFKPGFFRVTLWICTLKPTFFSLKKPVFLE